MFTENDKFMIEKAVRDAEIMTNAEIVPMVVRRSSGGEEVIRGLFIGALLGMMLGYGLEIFGLHYGYAPLFSMVVAGVFYLITRQTDLGRFFLSPHERQQAALVRAELEFYRHKLSLTEDRTAVLIFISTFEHQVVVLGDEAIAKVIPDSTWGELCQIVVEGIKKGTFAHNMVSAVERMGKICSDYFPAKSLNPNEISNHMIVKD